MKKIVLILCFVFGFCFGSEALNLRETSQIKCTPIKELNTLNDAIYYENYIKFKKILNEFPNLINCIDQGNLRPLDYALVYYEKTGDFYDKPFFETLVKNGADLNYKIEEALLTPIQYATIIMNEDYLLEFFNKYKHKIDINLNYNNYNGTVLTIAHRNNYKRLFKVYLENGAIVDNVILTNITYKILEPFYTKTKYFSLKNDKATDEQKNLFKSEKYKNMYDDQLYYLNLSLMYLKNENEKINKNLYRLFLFANLMNDEKLIDILIKD